MGSLVGWIEALKHGPEVVGLARFLLAALQDQAILGVLPLYALAFAWLTHRWMPRGRPHRLTLSRGSHLGGGLLRLLGAVLFLALGLFLAVTRSAGRSTFHSGARF